MRIALLLTLVLAPLAHAAAGSQQVGPPAPKPAQEQECEQDPANPEEIVVCGERWDEEGKYLLPEELRGRGQIGDRHMSWDARVRDLESIDRYSSQTVGPFGYMQQSRQVDCEWRAARQQAQGRQMDCTRRTRRDEPTDWQRR